MSQTKSTAHHQIASLQNVRSHPKNRVQEVKDGSSRPQSNPAVSGTIDGDVSENMQGAAK